MAPKYMSKTMQSTPYIKTENLLNRDELLQKCTEQGELEVVPGALLDPRPQGLKRDYLLKKN